MQRRLLSRCFLPVLALFLFTPAGSAETLDEVLKSYVGQKRILRHARAKKTWKLDWRKLPKLKRGCDTAVEVVGASLEDGSLRLRVDLLGTALVPPLLKGSFEPCKLLAVPAELLIRNVPSDTAAESLRNQLENFLQSSEAYLAARGVSFEMQGLDPDDDELLVLLQGAHTPPNVTRPRQLLIIFPGPNEAVARAGHTGVLVLQFVVGRDGRVRDPRIVRSVGSVYDERLTLRGVDMWRFEPARQDGRPVSALTQLEWVLGPLADREREQHNAEPSHIR